MKTAVVLNLLSLGLSQTLTGTGAISFSDDTKWQGGLSPLTAIAAPLIAIQTDAQVSVDASFTSALGLSLGDVTTNTSLILQNGVNFAVGGLTWVKGEIDLGISSKFVLNADGSLTGSATPSQRRIVGLGVSDGSEFQLGGTLLNPTVLVSGGLGIDGVIVTGDGGKFTLNNGATLRFTGTSNQVKSLTVDGMGTLEVAGNVEAVTSLAITKATVTGELTTSAADTININGPVTVSGTGSLGGNQATVAVMGAGSLTYEAGTSIPGGTFSGAISIAPGAAGVALTNPTTFGGSATLNVTGILKARASPSFNVDTEVRGSLIIGDTFTVQADVGTGKTVAVIGGTLNVMGSSDITIGTNAGAASNLRFSGTSTWAGGNVILNTMGTLEVADGTCTVSSDAMVTGTGNAAVKAAGEFRANAKLALETTKTTVFGNLTLDASADVTVASATTLELGSGGRVKLMASGGKVTVESGATLVVAAGASASHLEGGPRIDVDGAVVVNAGAQATVTGAGSCEIRGNGNFTVAGHFRLEGTADVRPALKVVGNGMLSIAAMVQADFTNVTLGAKTSVEFNAAGGFNTVRVNGTLDLSGNFEVVVPASEPASVVVLIRAGHIQGSFSASAVVSVRGGRRLLASGSVVTTDNTVEYHPGASTTSPASKAECFFALLPLVGLLL